MKPDAKTPAAMKRILNQFTVAEHLDMFKENLDELGGYKPQGEGESERNSRWHFGDALTAARCHVEMIRKLLKH